MILHSAQRKELLNNTFKKVLLPKGKNFKITTTNCVSKQVRCAVYFYPISYCLTAQEFTDVSIEYTTYQIGVFPLGEPRT